MELEIETTGIADWLAVLIPSPQSGVYGFAVRATGSGSSAGGLLLLKGKMENGQRLVIDVKGFRSWDSNLEAKSWKLCARRWHLNNRQVLDVSIEKAKKKLRWRF